MPLKVTEDDQVRAQAHAVGLLNQLDSVMTGWVLGHPREQIEKLTSPLYDLLDKAPPQKVTA